MGDQNRALEKIAKKRLNIRKFKVYLKVRYTNNYYARNSIKGVILYYIVGRLQAYYVPTPKFDIANQLSETIAPPPL